MPHVLAQPHKARREPATGVWACQYIGNFRLFSKLRVETTISCIIHSTLCDASTANNIAVVFTPQSRE